MNVYVSGALTGVGNLVSVKALYEAIGSTCKEIGLQAYVPHLATDPTQHPDVSPQKVFETDKHQVSHADLVIAYIGIPSLGVGMELAYAETNAIPIIILYERGKHISRFPRGIPTVVSEIQFNDHEDALVQLRGFLKRWRLQHSVEPSSVSS